MNDHEKAAIENDRKQISDYMKMHHLEEVMNDVLNELVKDRPEDPFLDLAAMVESKSHLSGLITAVRGKEIIGPNGLPALEAEVETIRGVFKAVVTGMGPYDGDESRFAGKGLTQSATLIGSLLCDRLVGKRPASQDGVDNALSADPSFPANAVLALSIAACKAGADANGLPLFRHVAALAGVADPRIPLPWFNLVNGGAAASNDLPMQSISFAVSAAATVSDAVNAAAKMYASFPAALVSAVPTERRPNIGRLGGFAPAGESAEETLGACAATAKAAGLEGQVKLSVNMCVSSYSSQLSGEDSDEGMSFKYELSKFAPPTSVKMYKNSGEMVDMYYDWFTNYPLVSVEDGFEKKDSSSLIGLKEKIESEAKRRKDAGEDLKGFGGGLGGSDALIQLVGNESLTTAEEITRADEKQTVNTCALHLAKAGTVSKLIALNAKAESLGMPVLLVADNDGDANDVFSTHLAVGLRCAQFRGGGLLGFVHANKYNELVRISAMEKAPKYIGAEQFRK